MLVSLREALKENDNGIFHLGPDPTHPHYFSGDDCQIDLKPSCKFKFLYCAGNYQKQARIIERELRRAYLETRSYY